MKSPFRLLALFLLVALPQAGQAAITKSIHEWAVCDGATDDTAAMAIALVAAKHNSFTLVVDCHVRIHVGQDYTKALFIDDGTTITFAAGGKITVDNVFTPAFVIANASNVTLTGWNLEYDASLPVTHVGGPAGKFNDITITNWLAANKAIFWDKASGHVTSAWHGPTNAAAVFFVIGDVSDLRVTGMHAYAPKTAGGDRFIPMLFSMTNGFRSNQTVVAKLPETAQYFEMPHRLLFKDIDLDGTYMGWQGSVRDAVFEHIRSHRYGDLQDANGGTSGGVDRWFAPPHLFYLNYNSKIAPALFNRHIYILDVVDDGTRLGVARDTDPKHLSGHALSLKLGCIDCKVDHYISHRPDGFLDVLPSENLTLSNIEASYNSGFLNNVFPGWRFPAAPYKNVTFENVRLNDESPVTIHKPMGDSLSKDNSNIVFDHVTVTMNRWGGQGSYVPKIEGAQSLAGLVFKVGGDK